MKNHPKQVILHIGLPKTATTSIQNTLFLNHSLLKKQYNIDYCPELCRINGGKQTGHHQITWQQVHQSHPFYKESSFAHVKEHLAYTENSLLSSEWLTLANTVQKISQLVKHWGLPEERKVVLVVREEFDYLRSRWLQSVKMGHSFLSLWQYYHKYYKTSRKTLKSIIAPWQANGFDVEIIKLSSLIETKQDITLAFVNKLFATNIPESQWQRGQASNVSPAIAKVDLYRMIIVALSKIPLLSLSSGQFWSAPRYNKVHNTLCKFLPELPFLDLKSTEIKEDLATLSPFFDVD